MTQWEYLVLAERELNRLRGVLDARGGEGWELVSASYTLGGPERVEVTPLGTSLAQTAGPEWIAIMKRPRA